jgi:hypothetical protein
VDGLSTVHDLNVFELDDRRTLTARILKAATGERDAVVVEKEAVVVLTERGSLDVLVDLGALFEIRPYVVLERIW